MIHRLRLVLSALLLVATVVGANLPAFAAERVEELPEVRPVSSARFDLAVALNDFQLIVGKGEITSATRAHYVLKLLDLDGSVAATLEVVLYDDKIYVRQDVDTQWYVTDLTTLPVDAPTSAPSVDVEAAPISSIGAKEIAGVLTNQYQIWISGENLGEEAAPTDRVVLDFFVGQQVNYLHQYQISSFLTDPDLGDLKLEQATRLYDFNNPEIVVGPPANAVPSPTPAAAGLLPRLRNGGLLSTLAAPLSTPELRALTIKHFNR